MRALDGHCAVCAACVIYFKQDQVYLSAQRELLCLHDDQIEFRRDALRDMRLEFLHGKPTWIQEVRSEQRSTQTDTTELRRVQ